MHLVKQLGSVIFRAGLMLCGGLVVLTAFAAVAKADGSFSTAPAPEIDPGSIASAATLLVGSVMLLTSRRKQK